MTMTASSVPRTVVHRLRWAIVDGWTLTHRSLLHWVHQPAQIAFGLLFPVMLVVMFGFLFGGAMTVPGGGNFIEFMMPGMFVMTMAFGIGETMVAINADSTKGVTDRFRSMPMAPSAVVLGRCVADLLYSMAGLAVMFGCGLAAGWRWHGSVGATLLAVGLLVLLRFSVLWIGVYLGLVISSPEASAGVQTLLFPLTMVTNTFADPTTMPAWLGAVAEWNPLSATVTAVRELFGNPGGVGQSWLAQNSTLMAIGWPLLILVIFFPLSVRRYQRLSR